MSAPDTPRHSFDLSVHKLRKLLDSQIHSPTLSFPDAFLGDSPCTLLSQYIQENPYVTSLDLKGNNLTADGLQALAGVFRPPCRLETANLEWNSIGAGGGRGLEVLANVLADNDSLLALDLRNNKINAEGAAALASMLKSNSTLQVLDLRWNEVGAAGGRSLLSALQVNKTLLSLELAGNKVPDDLLQRIDALTAENRLGAERRSVSGDLAYRPIQEEDTRPTNQSASAGRPSENEAVLEMERKRFREMRSELMKELEQERALRMHTEASLVALKEEAMKRESRDSKAAEVMEMRLSEANHEKAELASELTKIRDLLEKTNDNHQDRLRAQDNKIAQLIRAHAQAEDVLRSEMDKLRLEHSLELEQVNKDWERRGTFNEEQFAKVKAARDELDDAVKSLKSQLISLKADHESALKATEERARDETERRLLQQLKLQEQKMEVMEENRRVLMARIEALQQEVTKIERKHTETHLDSEEVLTRVKEERDGLSAQVQETQLRLEQMQGELTLRSSQIEALNAQLAQKDEELAHAQKLHTDQLEAVGIT